MVTTNDMINNIPEEALATILSEPDYSTLDIEAVIETSTDSVDESTSHEEPHTEILPNSKTFEMDETTSRFSSAIWYEKIQEKVITLAGLGGIGSYVGFLLARLKPKSLFIYDDDKVEAANMSGQLYGNSDLNKYKATALTDMVNNYSNFYSVFAIESRFTVESEPSNIMICGFDNMEARKCFFQKWLDLVQSKSFEERKDCLFIDGRLAAEEFQILCIRGDDDYNIDRYAKEFLFSDEEADETICSYKQTSFCANMIASYMVNLFVNFCANQANPIIERDLPFLSFYNAETMYFKTES